VSKRRRWYALAVNVLVMIALSAAAKKAMAGNASWRGLPGPPAFWPES